MGSKGTGVRYPSVRELSPQGQAAAEWFKHLARALTTCRLYRREATTSILVRRHIFQKLTRNLEQHGSWTFRITAAEIFLAGEPVVHPTIAKPGEEAIPGKEEQLPFMFYRDGVRGLTLSRGIPDGEFVAFFEALLATSRGPLSQDDIVTLLWQANPTSIRLDSVPLEQVIYLSMGENAGAGNGRDGLAADCQGGDGPRTLGETGNASDEGGSFSAPGVGSSGSADDGTPGQADPGNAGDSPVAAVPGTRFAEHAAGGDLRGDLGLPAGRMGSLHRDTSEDWAPVHDVVHVPIEFDQVLPGMEMALRWFEASAQKEQEADWTTQMPDLVHEMLALDDTVETRRILAQALTGWMAQTIQDLSWDEWEAVLQLMHEVDADGSLGRETLSRAVASLDLVTLARQLDLCSDRDHARFLTLASGTGAAAVPIGGALLSRKRRVRTRAMGGALLCTLCDGRASPLAPLLNLQSEDILEQALSIVELIADPKSMGLLTPLLQHSSPNIRRGAVLALAGVPSEAVTPMLLARLDETHPDALAAVLKLLARYRDASVARVILEKIATPSFDGLPEASRRGMFWVLGEVAEDSNVPAIRALLFKKKWMSKRTLECMAAARALVRIGSPGARAALEDGARAQSKVVREACALALSSGAAS